MHNKILILMVAIIILGAHVAFAVPTISFTTPTDADNLTKKINYTYVNFSVTNSTLLDSVIVNLNGTNLTVAGRQLLLSMSYENETNDSSIYNINMNPWNLNCSKTLSGKIGGACWFDGQSSGINITTTDPFISVGDYPFTIEMWIRPDSVTDKTQTILWKRRPDIVPRANINISLVNNTIVYQEDVGTPATSFCQTAGLINAQDWQHLAFVANPSTTVMAIYVNGTLLSTSCTHIPPPPSSSTITIGFYGGNNGVQNVYSGMIDELRFWNTSRSNVQINNSMYSSVGKFFVNVSNLKSGNYTYFGFVNQSNTSYASTSNRVLSIGNTEPVANQVNITPTPATLGVSLTCAFGFFDNDSDLESGSAFRWFNDSGIIPVTNQTIFSSNISNGANITCEVRPKDAVDFGTRVNSSRVNIGDLLTPLIFNTSQTSSSVTSGSIITFRMWVKDEGSPIGTSYFEVEDANGVKTNLSMDVQGSNTANQNVLMEKNYTTGSPIGNWYGKFWVSDSNSNLNSSSNRNVSFTVSTSTSSGSGGGGSSVLIITGGNVSKPLITFGVDRITVTVINVPTSPVRSYRINNLGASNFVGSLSVGDSIKPYVFAEICSFQSGKCSKDQVSLSSGEAQQLNVYFTVDNKEVLPVEGTINLVNSIDQSTYQLPVTIENLNMKTLAYFGVFMLGIVFLSELAGVKLFG